jgi:hypothetical protein
MQGINLRLLPEETVLKLPNLKDLVPINLKDLVCPHKMAMTFRMSTSAAVNQLYAISVQAITRGRLEVIGHQAHLDAGPNLGDPGSNPGAKLIDRQSFCFLFGRSR